MSALPALQDDSDETLDAPSSGYTSRHFSDPEAVKHRVLALVTEENYDMAIRELERYASHPSEFPNFKNRVSRYIDHCIELIAAIDAKRGFPGKMALTMARQQELNDRVKEHFRDLQKVLARVEWIVAKLKADDARSTVWVIRSLCYAVLAIALTAFVLELGGGLLSTGLANIEWSAHWLADYLSGLF